MCIYILRVTENILWNFINFVMRDDYYGYIYKIFGANLKMHLDVARYLLQTSK